MIRWTYRTYPPTATSTSEPATRNSSGPSTALGRRTAALASARCGSLVQSDEVRFATQGGVLASTTHAAVRIRPAMEASADRRPSLGLLVRIVWSIDATPVGVGFYSHAPACIAAGRATGGWTRAGGCCGHGFALRQRGAIRPGWSSSSSGASSVPSQPVREPATTLSGPSLPRRRTCAWTRAPCCPSARRRVRRHVGGRQVGRVVRPVAH
jgi:hypothetical protein